MSERRRRIGWESGPVVMSDGRTYAPPTCPDCGRPDWPNGEARVRCSVRFVVNPDGSVSSDPVMFRLCPHRFHASNRVKVD